MDIYIHTHIVTTLRRHLASSGEVKEGVGGHLTPRIDARGDSLSLHDENDPLDDTDQCLIGRSAATRCNKLQHTATYCHLLHRICMADDIYIYVYIYTYIDMLREIFWMILINSALAGLLRRTATHCYILQHCHILRHAAAHMYDR